MPAAISAGLSDHPERFAAVAGGHGRLLGDLVDVEVVEEGLVQLTPQNIGCLVVQRGWVADQADRVCQPLGADAEFVRGSVERLLDPVQESLAALRQLFESRPDLLAEATSEARGNRLVLDFGET